MCEGDENEFIGCCDVNPCGANKGKCPSKSLHAASFSGQQYDQLATQDCDNDQGPKIWWTCKFNTVPFMGCCLSNACGNDGCNSTDLVAAKLSKVEYNRMTFLEPADVNSTSVPSATESSTPSATSSSAAATSTASSSEDSGLGTGALVGISVGATLGALLVLGLLFYRCFWLPRKRQQGQPMTQVGPNEYQPQTPANASFTQQASPHSASFNRTYKSQLLEVQKAHT